MGKYSLLFLSVALFLFVIFIGGSYPFVEVTPEMVANQLIIDVPKSPVAGNITIIAVTPETGGKLKMLK